MVRAFSAFLKRHGSKQKRLEEAEKRQVEGVDEEATLPRCHKIQFLSNGPGVFSIFVNPRGIPVNRWRPKCAETLVKHSENEQSKRPHSGLWGEYFGSQVVPVEGGKGGGKPPPGKGEGEM